MRSGQDSDTALRGANHISGAEHLTILPKSMRALLFIPRLLRYDFIVAQDNLLLGYVVSMCARVFGFPTKWLYVAMTSSTLMRRHANHPVRLSLFKKFWSSYARIACISYEQIEDFVRFGVPRSHIVFVPFGVDARFFHSTDESLEEDLVVSVGRDAGRDPHAILEIGVKIREIKRLCRRAHALHLQPRRTGFHENPREEILSIVSCS